MADPKSASSEERLRQASQALVEALTDRTIGAADRKVTDLTDRMERLAQNGGLSLPDVRLPRPHLPDVRRARDHLPDLPLPDVHLPDVQLPRPRLPDVDVPRPHLPEVHVPRPHLPDVSLPRPHLREVHLPRPHLPHLHLPRPHLPHGTDKSDQSDQSDETKVTTIIEEIDVGAPVSLTYDQWTAFGSFPSFMEKVENVDAVDDRRLTWRAQIWWAHREWESTIIDQIPDERIVWKSQGKKGYVDGAVTFHELTPDLTRIILVLEYHPKGLLEHTANLWRAQARRVGAELQHFRRHVMTQSVLDPAQVHGWRGVIANGEVVEDAEDETDQEANE